MKLIRTASKKTTQISLLLVLFVFLLGINLDVFSKPYDKSTKLNQFIKFSKTNKTDSASALHYAYSGDSNKPGILFIHGTPGGWGAFELYLDSSQLQQDFFMVSVDRLGWGQSTLSPKKINGDFKPQAQSIKMVMDQYPDKKWTIVGHSLGASIAPKVALEAPVQTQALLLLAGSLNPKLGAPRWYNRAASTWVVSRLIGESMRYSNREIMGLRKQLKLMDQQIKASSLNVNLIVMQGKKDRLVSPKNPSYINKAWANNFKSIELIELVGEGHFLPWNQTPLVISSLYKLNPVTTNATP